MQENNSQYFEEFELFKSLFYNAKENNVIIINTDGIIIDINEAFTACFGYTAADIVNKHFEILFTDKDRQKDNPRKELHKVITQGQASDNNYLMHKDKTCTWVSGESVLVKNDKGKKLVVKIIQNINEMKDSESSIMNLNTFNENILKSIEDVVIVLDSKMHVIKANRSFFELFRLPEETIYPVDFAELLRGYDWGAEMHKKITGAFVSGKGFSNYLADMILKDGEERFYDVTCMPMNHTYDSDTLLIVAHDMTIQKLVEKKKEDMMGFVAHELRNPLAGLMLSNEMLEESIRENNQDDIKEFQSRIKKSILRLNKMVDELYEATIINAGNFTLEKSFININTVINETVDVFQVTQPHTQVLVEGSSNMLIYADAYRLTQVLSNYISNAIKYSNNNSDITITIQDEENKLTVGVKDKGPGIPLNQQPYIFERFFRAEKTKNLVGIGLGLYLARQIIHAHNGKVWVESEEGKGSSFYFSVPVK